MTTREAPRDARAKLRATRTLYASYEGRCQFCGQWTSAANGFHTTWEGLATGKPMCQGKPRGRRRLSLSITRNGLNPNGYPLTADDRAMYVVEIAQVTKAAKQHGQAQLVLEPRP